MEQRFVKYRTGDGLVFDALVCEEVDENTLNLFVRFDDVPNTPSPQLIRNAKPFAPVKKDRKGRFLPDHGWFEGEDPALSWVDPEGGE